jgi:hemin uptake protein HemP
MFSDIPRSSSPALQTSVAVDERRSVAGELDSRALFGCERRLVILHQGERYTLQVTRAGKLLLTK